eukprot:6196445-Pleurochrysis_carterae.AAC.2
MTYKKTSDPSLSHSITALHSICDMARRRHYGLCTKRSKESCTASTKYLLTKRARRQVQACSATTSAYAVAVLALAVAMQVQQVHRRATTNLQS